MLIWGSRNKAKQIGSGGFFCPNCREERTCEHKRVSRYFTLYFIPTFPMQTLAEYLECTTCHTQYGLELLSMSREEIQAAVEPWTCLHCNNRNAAGQETCLNCGAPRFAPAD